MDVKLNVIIKENSIDHGNVNEFQINNVIKEENTVQDVSNRTGKKLSVHMFYYPWYASEEYDKDWNHWNHNIIPHWEEVTKNKFIHDVTYQPPNDIGTVFYPFRGPYSSADPSLIDDHMQELKDFLVVCSWWGQSEQDRKDGEGYSTDILFTRLFERAEKFGTQIAFHFEPYEGRTALSTKNDIEYVIKKYGSYKSFYRDPESGLPVVYLYDSYHITALSWATIFQKKGSHSIRGTKYDAQIISLLVSGNEKNFILDSGFDGFYSYFAANGFTYASSIKNWKSLTKWAKQNNLISSISVGPGYDDIRIRPWNSLNQKSRNNGEYYEEQWKYAIDSNPDIISITSYNEWMEGTQIESVKPKTIKKTIFNNKPYTYHDYGDLGPHYYINTTKLKAKNWKNK